MEDRIHIAMGSVMNVELFNVIFDHCVSGKKHEVYTLQLENG